MYYAQITGDTGICYNITESDTEINDSLFILLDSYDESYLFRKKYVNGEWVDTTTAEAMQYNGHHVGIYNEWLDNYLGDKSELSTTDKTSLVNAVNECFLYANNGKEAIAEAIIGVDDSITIPDGATFAQLAELIGQLGGLQIANGTMSEITTPESIAQETGFQPKLVILYNVGSGTSNINVGLYVASSLLGSQVSDSYYGLGGTLTRYTYPFTITETGFTFANHGACTNLKWIAMG